MYERWVQGLEADAVFFGREGCSRHTIRVNAISCSSQSLGRLSLARPDRSSAYTSLLLDFEYSNHSNIHDKKNNRKSVMIMMMQMQGSSSSSRVRSPG